MNKRSDNHVDRHAANAEEAVSNKAAIDTNVLGFPETVMREFRFLQNQTFEIADFDANNVQYRRENVIVDIFREPRSYEIDASLSRDEDRYSLSEIIRLTDPSVAAIYRSSTATTPEQVASGVKKLAALIAQYAGAALSGNDACFTALAQQRVIWSETYALDVREEQVRPKAEEAFRQGNYALAISLYKSIRPRLTPAEEKKSAMHINM